MLESYHNLKFLASTVPDILEGVQKIIKVDYVT